MVSETYTGVSMHADSWHESHVPAVNVKAKRPDYTVEDVARDFSCSIQTAEQAANDAFEISCREFWQYWTELLDPDQYFAGFGAKFECQGRSAGWLAVLGLPEVETWTGNLLTQWLEFQQDVTDDVIWHCSYNCIKEIIECNELAVDPVSCPCCGTSVHPSRIAEQPA